MMMRFLRVLVWRCILWSWLHLFIVSYAEEEYRLEHRWSLADSFVQRGKLVSLGASSYAVVGNGSASLRIPEDSGAGFYQLKLCQGEDASRCISAIVKQCLLEASDYRFVLELHKDTLGSIVGLSLLPNQTVCEGKTRIAMSKDITIAQIEVTTPQTAPVPDVGTYVRKMEEEKERKSKGETEDNRSFIGKYWMYIVPVFILFMMASNQGDQGGE